MISIEIVAEMCHEANRVYCQNFGDYSQEKWCELSDADRQKRIASVREVLILNGNGNLKTISDKEPVSIESKVYESLSIGLLEGVAQYV